MLNEFFNDLIAYEFLQKALFTGVIVGIVCGVIGCFIILRGLALMGDAISHAVLPGVAISYMLGINFFYGATVVGLLAALGIGFINRNSLIKNDSAIGIVFSGFFALGTLLVAKAQTATNLTEILFGNVLTVKDTDRMMTVIVTVLVLTLVVIFYKELELTSFDPTMAQAAGLSVKFIHYMLMVMLTLVTVVSLQTVGVILVVALLITPAATAYLLTKQLSHMIFLSATLSALSTMVGILISFKYNLASGPVIVLVITVVFIIVFMFAPKTGWIFRTFGGRKSEVKN